MKRIQSIAAAGVAAFLLWAGAQAAVQARPDIFAREIPIATSPAQERLAALGVNSRGDYLVVWETDAGGGDTDIWGQFIDLTGRRLSQAFPIAATAKPEFAARVAYNPDDNEFLVAYEYAYQDGDHDIRGQRVDGDGPTLIGNALTIGVTTGDERTPDVAYLSATGQYLVAYAMDGDIWARRVARRGHGDGGGDFLGDEFPVASDPLSPESQPAVAAAFHENYFLVTYTYTFSQEDDDVLAQRVRGAETSGDQLLGEKITLASSLEREHASALAYSPRARAFITLWQVSIPFSEDVLGRWVDAGDLSSKPFIGDAFDVAADAVTMERWPQVDVDAASGQVVAALASAAAPGDWYRPAIVRLNGDPRGVNPVLVPPRALPERAGHALAPRIKLAAGRTHFFQGYTLQWGTSPEADMDAYLYLTDRWSVTLPMILR